MFLMRSLIKLHDAGGGRKFLEGAHAAAKILSSWIYLWKVPMPKGTVLGDSRFDTTGWAGCDVIPAGSYLDDELLEFTGDMVRIAEATGDFDMAQLTQAGMQGALSMPNQMLGYAAPGIQWEGIMTAYWMSDPEKTEFSGAANKSKGQRYVQRPDQWPSSLCHFDLVDRYGMSDFDRLRERLFGSRGGAAKMRSR